MVFKGRFFQSKKSSSSDISSPEGSNNPRSTPSTSNSPIKSDKTKPNSTSKTDHPPIASSLRQIQVKDASKSTFVTNDRFKTNHNNQKTASVTGTTSVSVNLKRKGVEEGPGTVSPILASSLGLNKIKTRSGPLPQESYFKFDGASASSGGGGKSKGGSKLSNLVNDAGVDFRVQR